MIQCGLWDGACLSGWFELGDGMDCFVMIVQVMAEYSLGFGLDT